MLDNWKIASRRTRGVVTVTAVAVIVMAGWIGLTVWLYRNPMDLLDPPLFDWTDGPFGGFFVLNLIFGMNMVIVSHLRHYSTESGTHSPFLVSSHGAMDHCYVHKRPRTPRSTGGACQRCFGWRSRRCLWNGSRRFNTTKCCRIQLHHPGSRLGLDGDHGLDMRD